MGVQFLVLYSAVVNSIFIIEHFSHTIQAYAANNYMLSSDPRRLTIMADQMVTSENVVALTTHDHFEVCENTMFNKLSFRVLMWQFISVGYWSIEIQRCARLFSFLPLSFFEDCQ